MMFNKNFWQRFLIVWVWIFHFFGVIGIYFWDRNFFLRLSWITLMISAFAIIINLKNSIRSEWVGICLSVLLGFLIEVIGVRTKIIFGDYCYGENLGVKMLDVPVIIGINWFILAYSTSALTHSFQLNKWLKILLSSCCMVGVDLLIEPLAPIFDYWHFMSGIASWHNYLGWFIVSFFIQWILHEKSFAQVNPYAAWQILIAITLFFSICHLFET